MARPDEPARPDIHTRITQQIIAQLEAGTRPWSQPWTSGGTISRPLRHDGTPYSGINIVLLWSEAAARGFTASTWMTFRQALALGAHVRKGERGSTVVYANTLVRSETDDSGEDAVSRIPSPSRPMTNGPPSGSRTPWGPRPNSGRCATMPATG